MTNEEGKERKIVVPGETIIEGEDYLPGDGTRREGEVIVANRYGLSDVSDRLIKIIPLSGVYHPRRGNTIIGQVKDITFNGWILDFGGAANAFLGVSEVTKYINKNEMRDYLDFDDLVVAKVNDSGSKTIAVTTKMRGLGKLEGGIIMKINPHKVPRVIGKEGSMVNIIKEETKCNITVGQNGWVWIKSQEDNIDDELKTREIINFICENSHITGLTDKVEKFINDFEKDNKKGEQK